MLSEGKRILCSDHRKGTTTSASRTEILLARFKACNHVSSLILELLGVEGLKGQGRPPRKGHAIFVKYR